MPPLVSSGCAPDILIQCIVLDCNQRPRCTEDDTVETINSPRQQLSVNHTRPGRPAGQADVDVIHVCPLAPRAWTCTPGSRSVQQNGTDDSYGPAYGRLAGLEGVGTTHAPASVRPMRYLTHVPFTFSFGGSSTNGHHAASRRDRRCCPDQRYPDRLGRGAGAEQDLLEPTAARSRAQVPGYVPGLWSE